MNESEVRQMITKMRGTSMPPSYPDTMEELYELLQIAEIAMAQCCSNSCETYYYERKASKKPT